MFIGTKLNLIKAMGNNSKELDRGFILKPSSLEGHRVMDYKPTKSAWKLHKLIESGVNRVLWRGAMGCGKTYCTMKQIISLAYNAPVNMYGVRESITVICRNTYRELQSTSIVSFKEAWPSEFPLHFRESKADGVSVFRRKDDGTIVNAKFLFWAFDKPGDYSKLKSFNCTTMYLQEGCEMDPEVWNFGLLRVGRFPSTKNFADQENTGIREVMIVETNSFDYDHWLYDLFYSETAQKDPNIGVVDGGDQSDPAQAENLDRLKGGIDYYLKKRNSMPKEFWNVNVKNEFGTYRDAKLVFSAYNQAYNIVDDEIRPEDGPIFAGLDNSLNAALVIIQQIGTQRYKVIHSDQAKDEGMATSLGTMFSRARDLFPPSVWDWKVGGRDPIFSKKEEGSGARMEEYCQAAEIKHGVCRTESAVCGNNRLAYRINAVNERLATRCAHTGKPLLVIHRSCKHMIRAMTNFVYERVKSDHGNVRYSDKPVNNHYKDPCDALGYGLCRPAGGGNVAREIGYNYKKADEIKIETPYIGDSVII